LVKRLATGCKAGMRIPGGQVFSPTQRQDRGPPSILSNGIPCAISPTVNRPGREADNLPPSSTEVKWLSYNSNPLYVFMVVFLIN
jgi:hypothetical protein